MTDELYQILPKRDLIQLAYQDAVTRKPHPDLGDFLIGKISNNPSLKPQK